MSYLIPVPPGAPIRQAKGNSNKHAERISNPVVHVCAAVEGGLDELNHAAKGARTDEDGDQPKPTSAGQREGESREGNKCTSLSLPSGAARMTQAYV
jgi:hypothetical protein